MVFQDCGSMKCGAIRGIIGGKIPFIPNILISFQEDIRQEADWESS